MVASSRHRRRAADAAAFLALAAAVLLFLAPLALMVSTSLKRDDQIFSLDSGWLPRPVAWSNYAAALEAFPFARYLGNTLLVCGLTVIGTLLSSALPAYGFARLRWRGRDALFMLVLATLMLPEQVTMLPTFLIFRDLGWTGTYLPLVVPPFFGSAFSIFLLRQFFVTIPQELSDAARLDGCSESRIFWRIILPLSTPALVAAGLLTFTAAWTDFTRPLIYLTDERTYTLAIGLQTFVGRHASEWNLLMAAAAVATLPLVLLFLVAQRAFIQGVALTGMKA